MRNFSWLIILLICMVGLTGFSTTADPTQDSSIVFVDNDVGVDTSVDYISINKIFNVSTLTTTASLDDRSWYNLDIKQISFQANEKELEVILDIYHPPAKTAINSNRARENI